MWFQEFRLVDLMPNQRPALFQLNQSLVRTYKMQKNIQNWENKTDATG